MHSYYLIYGQFYQFSCCPNNKAFNFFFFLSPGSIQDKTTTTKQHYRSTTDIRKCPKKYRSECFSTPCGRGEASAWMLIYSFYHFLLRKVGFWRDSQVRNEARLTSIPNCSGNGFSFFCEMRRVLGISFLMPWRKEKRFKRTWKYKDRSCLQLQKNCVYLTFYQLSELILITFN